MPRRRPPVKCHVECAAAAKQPAKPGAKKGAPVLLAQSLDPTLRMDLLKTSEDSDL